MKHRLGNETKCRDYFFYSPKDPEEKGTHDGYCVKGHIINGRLTNKSPAKTQEYYGAGCYLWEDAEDRLTHFEVMTRNPDPKRTPAEAEYIKKKLRSDDIGKWLNKMEEEKK